MSEELEKYERPTLPHERKADPAYRAGGLATAGIEFGVTVVLFVLAGRWLDGKLGTDPWLTVVLALIGVAAAMTLLIRHATRLGAPPPKEDEDDSA